MKKKTIERFGIALALIAVLTMFAFFLKDILAPLFQMELRNDVEGARELLLSKGVLGGAAVILIEALQMVVVFIPAEFIQVSAGLSYPFYLALPLCDLGVCLGATLIFLLVRAFRVERSDLKSEQTIARYAGRKNARSVQMLMYLLFIMPIVPFGAICYYGSGTQIKYRRYLFTVATGVIPSIITSNLIGASAKAFIMHSLPLWLLVVIILFMMLVLFVLLWLFLDKVYFRKGKGTPESAGNFAFFKVMNLWRKGRQRLHFDREKLGELEGPFVILPNHPSFYDIVYVNEMFADYHPTFVANHHIICAPGRKTYTKNAGFIPKKLFYPDMAAIKIMRMLRAGYPVIVFPEGRMSVDGSSYPVVEPAGAFYKKIGYPLVLVQIHGAFFNKPKWRARNFKSDIYLSVERVITPDELRTMSAQEIDEAIETGIAWDESETPVDTFHRRGKAKGLENVLYRCVDCGALYTLCGEGETLCCSACGARHVLNERYRFDDEIGSISAYYRRIKALERETLDAVSLSAEVDVTVFSDEKPRKRKERGVCTLTRDRFTYRSDKISFEIETAKLPALAFSCNQEFELYYRDELYYFYPRDNRRQAARWALLVDLMTEERHEKEKARKDAD